jgi:c(7)-type cytochrome triheme protein
MPALNNHKRGRRRSVQFTVTFTAACCFVAFTWTNNTHSSAIDEPVNSGSAVFQPQEKDYSRFTHTNPYHSRMPCLLCHRRDGNSPRISFPGHAGHTPCIGCHALQFSDNSSPICTICHTATGMKRFPGLRSFGRKFDHDRHTRVSCSVCHKPSQRGVALSIPSGVNAHATCFTCHSSSAPSSMSSCNVCHQIGRLVRTPETAAAYRVNFSHARHEREGLNCASCHSVRSGGTGRQVTKPLASMHFAPDRAASCAACHNGTRAFGANDFANCKRCHIGNSFKF